MPRQYWFPKHYADAVQRWRVRVGFVLIAIFAAVAYPGRWSLTTGLPVAALGLLLRAWAAGHLDKNGRLATSGPFAFVRNPLYLGTLLTATGFAVASGAWWLPLVFAAVFLMVYVPVMELEEQHLLTLFPEARAYVDRVPLLLPTKAPLDSPGSRFAGSLYMRNEEYKALAAFAAGALFLAWRAGLTGL